VTAPAAEIGEVDCPPLRRSRAWPKVLAAIALAAVLIGAPVGLGWAARGYVAWKVTVTQYTVMGGDTRLRVTLRAVNTGTNAAGALCQVTAWIPPIRSWSTGYGLLSHVVPPGRSARVVVFVPVPRHLASAVNGAIWPSCDTT
jgi:hypothetical protein